MKLLMKTNLFNRLIVGKPLGVGLENLLFFTYISFNDLTLVQLNSVCHTLKDSRRIQVLLDDIWWYLFGSYSSGLWAFLTFTLFIFDRLAFCKGLKTVSLNFREMNKEVFAIFRLNEAVTFTFVKPFYCS